MFRKENISTNSYMEEALHFKISDAPDYPFINQSFDLHISLVDDTGRLKVGKEVPMTIKLYFDDMEECSHQVLEIDRLTPGKIHSNGKAIIRVKLNTLTATFGDRRFVLVATPLIDTDSFITHAVSTPMTCIKYRLALENYDEVPSLWYKDQGGKLKSIDLQVKLVGPNGTTVVGKMVPLRLELRYNNGDIVQKQEILEATRDSRMLIGDSGSTLLRTRINEVSMRHQGKLFCIYVHPDTRRDPLSCDISPASTQCIEIRSKVTASKNKRSLEECTGSSIGSPMSYSSSPSGTVYGHGQGCISVLSTGLRPDACFGHIPSLSMPPSVTGRAATSTVANGSSAGVGIGRLSMTASSLMSHGTQYPQSAPHAQTRANPFSFECNPTAAQPTAVKTVPVCQASPAPGDIYAWAEMVTENLDSLRWRQIGQEIATDGTRPLYEMANPNDFIDDMIHKYTVIVREGGKASGVESGVDETSGDEEECEHRRFRRRIAHIDTASTAKEEHSTEDCIGTTGETMGEEHDLDVLPDGIKLGSNLSRDNSLYLAVGDIWQ